MLAASFNVVSDRRAKNLIEEIGSEYGLSYINSLFPVSYLMKDGNKRELGFVAQDIEETNKSKNLENDIVVVPENPDDSYYISYSKMVVPLVKAVQELTVEIEKLKKELELLKQSKE